MKLDISRQMPSGKWDVVKLMHMFKRELIARESCEQFESLSYHKNNGATEVFSTLQIELQKKFMCSYCKGEHPSNQCNVIMNAVARKVFLRENNKCYNCLKDNNTVNNCFCKYSCYICEGVKINALTMMRHYERTH